MIWPIKESQPTKDFGPAENIFSVLKGGYLEIWAHFKVLFITMKKPLKKKEEEEEALNSLVLGNLGHYLLPFQFAC